MVVAATMAWRHGESGRHRFFQDKGMPAATLGILAFDAGKTMCHLISLYNSLSDKEIMKLRDDVIKSKGVAYLNSEEECFLLNLACTERVEELNLAAATVSVLGQKCSDIDLIRFDLVYADLKLGILDLRKLQYGTRNNHKIIEKMEKLVSSTANLHAAMESLAEMDASEKKIQRWRTMGVANHCPKANVEYFNEKIAFQRKQVQHYKEVSLWNQTFDKTVGIMARVVCIVYARICSIFGDYITGCNENIRLGLKNYSCLLEHRELYQTNRCLHLSIAAGCGGGERCAAQHGDVDAQITKSNKVLRLAPPSTVGGAGLSLRYANVILFAERCLHAPATVGEDTRDALYEMLPESLRMKVRAKLKRRWLKEEEKVEEGDDGHSLAEGWRDAVEELMEWLSPVAHDTVRWHAERHHEKKRFHTKTTVLLLQTLHYSDLEKAEAAIVEVLVGLSCIYWYERQGWCSEVIRCKRR